MKYLLCLLLGAVGKMKYLLCLLLGAVGYCDGKGIPYISGRSEGGRGKLFDGTPATPEEFLPMPQMTIGGRSGAGGERGSGYGPIFSPPLPGPKIYPPKIYRAPPPRRNRKRMGFWRREYRISGGSWWPPVYSEFGDGEGGGHISSHSSSGSSLPSPWIPRLEPELPMPQMIMGGGGHRRNVGGIDGGIYGGISGRMSGGMGGGTAGGMGSKMDGGIGGGTDGGMDGRMSGGIDGGMDDGIPIFKSDGTAINIDSQAIAQASSLNGQAVAQANSIVKVPGNNMLNLNVRLIFVLNL